MTSVQNKQISRLQKARCVPSENAEEAPSPCSDSAVQVLNMCSKWGGLGLVLGFHQANSLLSAVLLSLAVRLSRLIWHLSLVLMWAQMCLWPEAGRQLSKESRSQMCSCSAFLHRGHEMVPLSWRVLQNVPDLFSDIPEWKQSPRWNPGWVCVMSAGQQPSGEQSC